MCIAAIIYSPLKQEYLNEMEKDNPHGGGVAWLGKSRRGNPLLNFYRGITAKQVGLMQQNATITYPYLLHFRWATHGVRGPEMAHPFPVGRRALNGQLYGNADKVLIHNGVWSGYDKYTDLIKAPAPLIKRASDTAIAAYLVGEYPDFEEDILKEVPWATATAKLAGDTLDIRRYGSTWTQYKTGAEPDNNWYSNLNWLPAKEWFAANRERWSTNYEYGENGRYYQPESRTPTPRKYWSSQVKSIVTYSKDWNSFTTAEGRVFNYNTVTKRFEESPAPTQTWEDVVKNAVVFGDVKDVQLVKQRQDWQDYVRARYGDEIAAELAKDDTTQRASTDLGDSELESLEEAGLVSEDPAEVNAWLAREYLRNAS